MMRALPGLLAVGLVSEMALAGSTIAPLRGQYGAPFAGAMVEGFGWNRTVGDGVPMIGDLYDNILTINGGGAWPVTCPPFTPGPCTQGFVDWTNPTARWGDDLHQLAGPEKGGPTAVITWIRYGYTNTVATATHTIQIYEMIPPSAGHPPGVVNTQYGDQLLSLVVPGIPTGMAMVTVTGLSVHAGTSVWIGFGESGPGAPGTFWLSGSVGIGPGPGSTHYGVVYDRPDYYGPGSPLREFLYVPYFYFTTSGIVAPNIQVALGGFVLPAPATIALIGLAGVASLRRQRPR